MTPNPAPHPAPVRTYGGWRRSRGIGLGGLTGAQTVVVLGAILTVILGASIHPRLLLWVGPPAAVVVLVNVAQWDGVPLIHGVSYRGRWALARLRGETSYRSGVMVAHEAAWRLPGVLAPTRLLSADDGAGGRYGLVWNRRTGTLTATLHGAATSTWLADAEVAGSWVANWGQWLAGLGHVPIVRWVAVTVDTAPDPGSRLADYVHSRLSPAAPAPAVEVMRELVQVSPAAAADVATRLSLTFDPGASPTRPKNLEEAVAEVSRVLPGLQEALGGCGLTVRGRATAEDLVGIVRTAFDPHVRGEVGRAVAAGTATRWLDWDSAGPVAAEEEWDHYRHDGACSVSWAWHEAPRQHVHADVLARLLAPGLHPRRVTLLYRPLAAGAAARLVDREVNAAQFRDAYRRRTGRDEHARDRADHDRAIQAAREEAMGAGVGLMSLFLTVTTTADDELPKAVADVEARADAAKIRLRRLWASQAAGFAATLPAGVCPPVLARGRLG